MQHFADDLKSGDEVLSELWVIAERDFLNEVSSVFRSMEASSAQRRGCLSRNRMKN